jgi:type II secretory pathway pseudopilin PulG
MTTGRVRASLALRRRSRATRDALRVTRYSGAVLLEVLVALTILATAGAAIVAMAGELAGSIGRVRTADAETRSASAFLDAVALWTREDLDRRLGEHQQGPWRLRIDRPTPALYVVTLSDGTSGVELLSTALFRQPPADAAP